MRAVADSWDAVWEQFDASRPAAERPVSPSPARPRPAAPRRPLRLLAALLVALTTGGLGASYVALSGAATTLVAHAAADPDAVDWAALRGSLRTSLHAAAAPAMTGTPAGGRYLDALINGTVEDLASPANLGRLLGNPPRGGARRPCDTALSVADGLRAEVGCERDDGSRMTLRFAPRDGSPLDWQLIGMTLPGHAVPTDRAAGRHPRGV